MTIRSDLATERPDVDEQHALPDLAGCERMLGRAAHFGDGGIFDQIYTAK